MTRYHSQLNRLTSRIEFLRHEMAAGLDAGHDVTAIHEEMDRLMGKRSRLAMSENGHDFNTACRDIDQSSVSVRAQHSELAANAAPTLTHTEALNADS